MNRILRFVPVLVFSLCSLHAATWTDVQGRRWEGEFVRVQGTQAIFMVGGKEYPFPMANLSPGSRAAIVAATSPKPPVVQPAAVAGNAGRIGSVALEAGKTVGGELPLDEKWQKALEKSAGREMTAIKFAVAVPEGFDGAKPQKVLFTCASSSGDGLSIPNMNAFVKEANAKGWVVMTADSLFGKPEQDNILFRLHLLERLLVAVETGFPKAKTTWTVATGGFSGGSGYASHQALALCDAGWNVSGMLLMNGGYHPLRWESVVKVSKAKAHKIPVFFSGGETDGTAKPDMVKRAASDTDRGGYKKIRTEWHGGGHSIHEAHVGMALGWFEELSGGK